MDINDLDPNHPDFDRDVRFDPSVSRFGSPNLGFEAFKALDVQGQMRAAFSAKNLLPHAAIHTAVNESIGRAVAPAVAVGVLGQSLPIYMEAAAQESRERLLGMPQELARIASQATTNSFNKTLLKSLGTLTLQRQLAFASIRTMQGALAGIQDNLRMLEASGMFDIPARAEGTVEVEETASARVFDE